MAPLIASVLTIIGASLILGEAIGCSIPTEDDSWLCVVRPSLPVHIFREAGRRTLDPDRLFRLLCDLASLPALPAQRVAHAS